MYCAGGSIEIRRRSIVRKHVFEKTPVASFHIPFQLVLLVPILANVEAVLIDEASEQFVVEFGEGERSICFG